MIVLRRLLIIEITPALQKPTISYENKVLKRFLTRIGG